MFTCALIIETVNVESRRSICNHPGLTIPGYDGRRRVIGVRGDIDLVNVPVIEGLVPSSRLEHMMTFSYFVSPVCSRAMIGTDPESK